MNSIKRRYNKNDRKVLVGDLRMYEYKYVQRYIQCDSDMFIVLSVNGEKFTIQHVESGFISIQNLDTRFEAHGRLIARATTGLETR